MSAQAARQRAQQILRSLMMGNGQGGSLPLSAISPEVMWWLRRYADNLEYNVIVAGQDVYVREWGLAPSPEIGGGEKELATAAD